MSSSSESRYLATAEQLQALTPEEIALRSRLEESINTKPLKLGYVRCFHSSDMLGGFSIVANGLRPSTKYNEELERQNLAAGVFVTKISPLKFGFPAKGWLERLLNNNYGKEVEGTSDQPKNAWVVNRGQVCIVVDIHEMLLKDARETDPSYEREGRNVHYIPKDIFDDFERGVLPRRNITYAFRATLEEPPPEVACILTERFAEAIASKNLFEIRWLLELGAPVDSARHAALETLVGSRPDDRESHAIALFMSETTDKEAVEKAKKAAKHKKVLQALQPHLSDSDLRKIEKALAGETESLVLTDHWKGDAKDVVAALLLEVLEPIISSVKILGLSGWCLGNSIAYGLGEALARNVKLESLDLPLNSIGDEGTVALARALEHNRTLQMLELQVNGIRLEGASALAKALEHNSSLQTLDLGTNDFGPQGASALAKALEHNSSLQRLGLRQSDIGPQGASALAKALGHNSTLQMLNLSSNKIGPEGASALAQALQQNNSLKSLRLSSNNIGQEGALALREALRHNSSLEELDLSDNDIGCEGVLRRALKHIPMLML